ncbi:MAG: hypothetical protein V8R75_14550 [Oscillospiraceae bacterium]
MRSREGPSRIARMLKREQVLCPTTYAYRKFGVSHTSLEFGEALPLDQQHCGQYAGE